MGPIAENSQQQIDQGHQKQHLENRTKLPFQTLFCLAAYRELDSVAINLYRPICFIICNTNLRKFVSV